MMNERFEGHTPGPWVHGSYDRTYVFDNDGEEICWTGARHESQAIPNARLIAAAPDLLSENERLQAEVELLREACSAALDKLQLSVYHLGRIYPIVFSEEMGDLPEYEQVIGQLRTAISKADKDSD